MNTDIKNDDGKEPRPRGRHARVGEQSLPHVRKRSYTQGANNPRSHRSVQTGATPRHAAIQNTEILDSNLNRGAAPARPSQARLKRQSTHAAKGGVSPSPEGAVYTRAPARHRKNEVTNGYQRPSQARIRRQDSHAEFERTSYGAGWAESSEDIVLLDDGSSFGGKAPNMSVEASSKKKVGKGKKILVGVLAVLLVAVLGIGGALAVWMSKVNSSMGIDDDSQMNDLMGVLSDASGNDPFYMLVLGSDARANETSRSDVIMLARLDSSEGTVHLISIPRDTMVTIEGYGTQKINAAYAYGGPALAVQTVSEFAGVPISHYAEIHFDELEGLVDMLGGVTVNVPESFYSKAMGIRVNEGEQVLSGAEALAFARERKSVTGGDFGRAQAQRQVAAAIIKEVLSTPATQLPGVISNAAGCVSTSMSLASIVDLALEFQGKDLVLYSDACPSYSTTISGASYACTMFDEWRTLMQRVDAGLDPDDETQQIPEKQLNNADLGAASNSPAPRDYHGKAANSLTTENVADVE